MGVTHPHARLLSAACSNGNRRRLPGGGGGRHLSDKLCSSFVDGCSLGCCWVKHADVQLLGGTLKRCKHIGLSRDVSNARRERIAERLKPSVFWTASQGTHDWQVMSKARGWIM